MAILSNEIRLILSTHFSFYRRHPWLIALFLLGLSLGSALLTAIGGLNQEAKTRYHESSALIEDPITHLITPLSGNEYIDGEIWVTLRRLGFTQAQPVLRGTVRTEEGRSLPIQGVDSLLWLNATQKKRSAKPLRSHALLTLLVDSQFAERVFTAKAEPIPLKLPPSHKQPHIQVTENIGLWALTDLATADYLLDAKGKLSFIELAGMSNQQRAEIERIITGKAQLVAAENQAFDMLSEAFFFNLTALALLGYIVAAFLSFNAIKLTLVARKKLLHQMHLLGCSESALRTSLITELVAVSLLTAFIGAVGGHLIANSLVLDVNRTLVGLYQLDKTLVIRWQWSKVLIAFALNVLAVAVIMLSQTKRIEKMTKQLFYALFVMTLLVGMWLFINATNEYQALLLCLCILLMFVLLVPKVLDAAASIPLHLTNPLAQWLHADTRYHLNDLRIAIIAILVALGSAISMQIMVKSFADTLNAHLQKQLSADIYLRTDQFNQALREALTNQAEVKQVSIFQQSSGKVNSTPATLESYGEDAQHYQHISLVSGMNVNPANFSRQGCLANEQSAIKFGLRKESYVEFVQNNKGMRCRISGFFYDYGNPAIRLLTLERRHTQSSLNYQFVGYSIRLEQGIAVARFSERLVNEFEQDSTRIYPNQRFKRYASELFNDTFMVTELLNSFILGVAILSLCISLLSMSAGQIKQLSILHNLGVTRQQLLMMKLIQTIIVVFFTILLTIPLGFALGFVLLQFVMPIAFGWTIHFSPDLRALGTMCITLMGLSIVCAYLPIRKLTYQDAKLW